MKELYLLKSYKKARSSIFDNTKKSSVYTELIYRNGNIHPIKPYHYSEYTPSKLHTKKPFSYPYFSFNHLLVMPSTY